jgi:probable F420-dependent oxidoreductase
MAAAKPRVVLVLSENWTLTPPRDLRALVRLAVEAEDAGVDAIMVSEHVVMGPSAGERGRMENPREYALPGNQDPATPWPDSLVLLSAIAAATTRVRLAACAIIAPLRHPLLLAKQLATLDLLSEGRLVAQPTVSWHRDEYEALGVPFERRGALLDDHLGAWEAAWRDTPASFQGRHVSFADVYVEPKPYRPGGPTIWLGGSTLHDRLLRRIVRHAHGFHPLGQPSDEELDRLRTAMAEAGRDVAELELVGGIRGTFTSPDRPAELGPALEAVPTQLARGFRTICFKPSQFTDDVTELPALCRRVVEGIERLAS